MLFFIISCYAKHFVCLFIYDNARHHWGTYFIASKEKYIFFCRAGGSVIEKSGELGVLKTTRQLIISCILFCRKPKNVGSILRYMAQEMFFGIRQYAWGNNQFVNRSKTGGLERKNLNLLYFCWFSTVSFIYILLFFVCLFLSLLYSCIIACISYNPRTQVAYSTITLKNLIKYFTVQCETLLHMLHIPALLLFYG